MESATITAATGRETALSESEIRIRESEQRFRQLFNCSNDAIFVVELLPDGFPGKFVEVNDVACKRLGYSREELLQLAPDDIDVQEYGRASDPDFLRKLQQDSQATIERVHVTKDGRHIPVEINVRLFVLDGKNALLGVARDISERKRADDALRFNQFALDRVSMTLAWMRVDNGRFVYANKAACLSLGYSREELLGMTMFDVDPEFSPARWAELNRELRQGGPRTLETTHQTKDGRTYPVEVTASVLEIAGEEYHCGFAIDITERKQAERTLRENAERLQAHINNSPMAVVGWDSEFKVTQWAGEAERVFGWSAAETLTKPIADLRMIYEEDIPLVQETISKLTDGVSRYVVSANRNITKDGRVIHCVWYNSVLLDEDGRMASVLSLVLDVTQQRRADDELMAAKMLAEKANAAKSRFLAAASHDLRQPLSALSLYIGALGGSLSPADGRLLANMKNCVASLNELLSNLLDLSKLEAGVVTPNVCDFAVDEILTKVISTHAPDANQKGLGLRCAYFGLTGRTDPVLFQRMLGNLVANAIRYTEKGSVLVGCRRRQGRIWVEVWDTGIGIPKDKTAEIFEEFKQLDNDERNRAKGSGLGLAVVAKTAALLDLQISVRSRVGKGSVFAVELPVGRAVPVVPHQEYRHRALRIALVEDNLNVAEAIEYALSSIGHQVVAAASRSELALLIDGTPPDIVISDYRLAGQENGLDVIASMRKTFREDLPAIIVTGDTDPELIRSLAENGVRVHHKPLELESLRSSIAELTA